MTDLLMHLDLYFENHDDITILYCYNSVAPKIPSRKVYKFHGLPSMSELLTLSKKTKYMYVIFDDLTETFGLLSKSARSQYHQFATDIARKQGISFIYISQQIYLGETQR